MSTKVLYRFNRTVYILAACLASFCLALMLLTWLQGPRLRSTQYDVAKITLAPDQRLTLQLNQAVPQITEKQITITPSAPIKAISNGKTIIVQFSQPLLNDTSYSVRTHLPGSHTLRYDFKTAPASLYYVTDSGDKSQVYRRGPGNNRKDELLFSGGHIDDYTVINGTLVLAVRQGRKDLLTLYNPATQNRQEVTLPEEGTVHTLQPAPDGRSLGFIFMPNDYTSDRSNTLLKYDLVRHTLQPVIGFDDKPIKTMDWAFAKDGKSIASLGFDAILLLLRPNTAPFPLGQYTSIAGFNFDGTMLYAGTLDGPQTVNLQTMQKRAVPAGEGLSMLVAKPLNASNGALLRIHDALTSTSQEKLAIRRDGKNRPLYDLPNDDGYIAETAIAPNDQYAALELRAGTTLQTKATIIDTSTGKTITSLPGGKVRWETITP